MNRRTVLIVCEKTISINIKNIVQVFICNHSTVCSTITSQCLVRMNKVFVLNVLECLVITHD